MPLTGPRRLTCERVHLHQPPPLLQLYLVAKLIDLMHAESCLVERRDRRRVWQIRVRPPPRSWLDAAVASAAAAAAAA